MFYCNQSTFAHRQRDANTQTNSTRNRLIRDIVCINYNANISEGHLGTLWLNFISIVMAKHCNKIRAEKSCSIERSGISGLFFRKLHNLIFYKIIKILVFFRRSGILTTQSSHGSMNVGLKYVLWAYCGWTKCFIRKASEHSRRTISRQRCAQQSLTQ